MPDHCEPKYFEVERQELWNGPPIMSEADKPVSFVARGAFARRASPAPSSDSAEDEPERIEPRGLPERKYKKKPFEHTYRARRKPNPELAFVEPDSIVNWFGNLFYKQHGQYFPYVDPDAEPEDTLRTVSTRRKDLHEPIPGLTKAGKGRSVPKAGAFLDPSRKHVCPVQECRKCFKKRDHLNRHIYTIHGHGRGPDSPWLCTQPGCDASATRMDNAYVHFRKHSHYQEIFMCTAEEGYKGLHLQNPRVLFPETCDVKPFKELPIPPMARDLWKQYELRRRQGEDVPVTTEDLVEKYMQAHPEEREPCLNGDPRYEWRMPQAGPEFAPYAPETSSLKGKFRLEIRREECELQGGGGDAGGSSAH